MDIIIMQNNSQAVWSMITDAVLFYIGATIPPAEL